MTEQEQAIEQTDARLYAAQLEAAIFEVMQGERKAAKLPIEPMVRLIAYVRTGSCKNASIKNPERT